VTVTNTSAFAWRRVEVWVNRQYRVTMNDLKPGALFIAPLDTFVAGFGQRFDARRQRVESAHILVTDDAGTTERREWTKR
jgi:cell wall assembly regulator SMI1